MISLISRLLGPPFISFIIYLPPLCTYTHSAGSSSLRAGKQGPAGKHFLPVSFESNVPFLSPYDGFFFFQRDSGASLITVFSIGVDRFYLDVSPSPKADSSFIKNNHPNGGPVRGADRRRICSRSYGFCTLQIKLSAVDRERRSRLKATAAPARLSGKEKKTLSTLNASFTLPMFTRPHSWDGVMLCQRGPFLILGTKKSGSTLHHRFGKVARVIKHGNYLPKGKL